MRDAGSNLRIIKDRTFEGLVNAITHRDYSIYGEYIRVYIFDDRMLIQSPGKLPGTVTLRNIRHRRFSRNPIIARVFTAFDWVRELNEGVDKIYQEMGNAGLPEPEYVNQDDYYLKLTLWNDVENRIPRLRHNISSFISSTDGEINLNSDQLAVLNIMSVNPSATYPEIAQATGFSESKVYRISGALRKNGSVERVGSRKSGSWRVLIGIKYFQEVQEPDSLSIRSKIVGRI